MVLDETPGLGPLTVDALRVSLIPNVTIRAIEFRALGGSVDELLRQNDAVAAVASGSDNKLSLVNRGLMWELPRPVLQLGIALRSLDISHNGLGSLSTELFKLSALWELVARNNKLTSLPSCLLRMRRLRVLDVEGNLLTEIPTSVGWLAEVEVLNFRANQIGGPPPACIGVLPRLRDLDLSAQAVDNPWQPPKRVPLRGEGLVLWARERLVVEEEAVRARVMVLGERGSGKTALVAALSGLSSKAMIR